MRADKLLALVLVTGLGLACGVSPERLAEHRQRAEQYIENEQWNEAKIELLNVLKADPDDAEAHFKMSKVLLELGDPEGVWQIKEAVRLSPNELPWRLRLAQILFAVRDYEGSLENVNAVLDKEPHNIDALLVRGGLRSVKGDLDALLDDLNAVLELDGEHVAALGLKAQALERSGDRRTAEEYMRRLLDVAPTTRNHLIMARFLGRQGRQDEALRETRQAIEVSENEEQRVQAQMSLANLYLNMHDTDATLKVLNEAREQSPGNAEIILTLARLHHSTGNRPQAEKLLRENVENRPGEPEPLLVLADYYRVLEDRERAIEAVDRALEIDPDSEPARLRRAEYLHGAKDEQSRQQAWEIVHSVLEENQGSALGLFTEGKFLLVEGKHEEAATSLRRVLDDQPTSNAHVLLGNAYQHMKQYQLARTEFQRALQLDAQNRYARTSLATLYLQMGEDELAAREALWLANRSPNDVRARLILGGALVRMGRPAEARDALKGIDASKLGPGAKLQLAGLSRRAGDVDRARAVLEPLLEDDQLRTRAQGGLIYCDLQERKHEEALARLKGWIAQEPDKGELYLYRGRVRMAVNAEKPSAETESDLKMAIAKDVAGVEAHILLATYYEQKEDLEGAIRVLQEARDIAPNNTRALMQLASIHERQGRLELARQNYEDVLRFDQSQPAVKNNLAWILASSPDVTDADLDRALQLAQDAKEALPNNPNVADTLGWVMLRKDVPQAAISLFHEAIAAYPKASPLRGTVRYHLAMAYERNGETARAIAELERALEEVPSFAERQASEALLRELRSS